MEKKCRKCRNEKEIKNFPPMSMWKYGVGSTCFECTNSSKKTQKELKRTKPKAIGKKRYERLKSGWSERQIHKQVRAKEKKCTICGCKPRIQDFKNNLPHVWCFAHILSKLMYPALRLFINNFALVCSIECHWRLDKLLAGRNKKEIEQNILNGKKVDI